MRDTAAPLRIMLVEVVTARCDILTTTLAAAGHRIVRVTTEDDLHAEVARIQPDVVIINVNAPAHDTLEDVHAINRAQPRPILVFTQDHNPSLIQAAVQAGVSAYVVGSIDRERVAPLLNVALARFEKFQTLRQDLADARAALADRKIIEKAKGILMKQRGMDEETAYTTLRTQAMARNLKLAELARSLLAAAELLA